MKAPGYQNINNIKLMQQNIGCNILAFSDILEDLTSSVTKVKKDEYSLRLCKRFLRFVKRVYCRIL